MSHELSRGAIEEIMLGNNVERPVLQVLGQKRIAGSGSADRYRLLLSDGMYSYSSAMLATQLNDLIINNDIDMYAIIRLDKYVCNTLKADRGQPERRVLIVLEVNIIAAGPSVGTKIGSPTPYKVGGGGSEQPSAAANPPMAAPQKVTSNTGMSNGHKANGSGGPTTPLRQGPGFANVKAGQNAPSTPGGTPSKVHPISCLNPYQNRWCIKARVSQKGNVRTYSNSRGEGKVFNINLLDESGEIQATLFNKEVDRFHDMIEMNKVYYVRKATLKPADKRYSSLANDYQMTFSGETEVIPCEDECDLPSVSFNFIPINELEQHEANSTVDVIGVVKAVNDMASVTSRASNREIKKRDIQIVDQNQVMIRLTLWGAEAENFDGTGNPVVAVKGCRLSDWGGRSLSAVSSSQIILNPDITEAHNVRSWYDSVGQSINFQEFRNDGAGAGSSGGYTTNWKSFAEAKGQNMSGDKPEYYTVKGTAIHFRKENSMYMACPQADCNKKVVDQANGYYRCEKCNKEFPNYKWRMILSANLADYSDNQWVTCFQDTAETVLGKTGEELGQMKEQDEAGYDQVFTDACFKSYIFRLRTKMETYNDEARMKTVCLGATPVDFVDYNKRLIEQIEKMLV